MIKNFMKKKQEKDIKMLLGNLREIELRADIASCNSIETFKECINKLSEAIDIFRHDYVETKWFDQLPEEDRFVLICQLGSMDKKKWEMKKQYFEIVNVVGNTTQHSYNQNEEEKTDSNEKKPKKKKISSAKVINGTFIGLCFLGGFKVGEILGWALSKIKFRK